MKLFERIKNLFKRKLDLRKQCVAAYGEDFGKMYDMINRGEAIGGFVETTIFIKMVEAVKQGNPVKLAEYG